MDAVTPIACAARTGTMPTFSYPNRGMDYQRSVYTRSDQPGQLFTFNAHSVTFDTGNNSLIDGIQNPNWRAQVARGQDASTPYSRTFVQSKPFRLFGSATTQARLAGSPIYDAECYTQRDYGFSNTVDGGDDTALREMALSRLKRRLSDNIGRFDALVPAAELRELRTLVSGTADLATSLVRSLIDIRRTRGRSAFRWASEAWLNYSFAVKPLVSDTRQLAEAVASFLERTDRSVRLVGSARKTWYTNTKTNNNTGAYLAPYQAVARIRHTLSYRYIAGLKLELKSSNNYGYSDHFGLGFEQLPSVGWELIPYSWIFDYFTTVGEYFGDTFVLPPGSTKYLLLNKLYKMECTTSAFHYVDPDPGNFRYKLVDSRCFDGFYNYTRLERTKLSNLPRASLRFRSVEEIGRNAVNRLLNLASVFYLGSDLSRAPRRRS